MSNQKIHYGYVINFDNGCHIQVELLHGRLLIIPAAKKSQPKVLLLKSTKMKLLCYLLENAKCNIVSREELLLNVWEASNLSSSYQRLLQVVAKLKEELFFLGAPADFIDYSRGKGYRINCKQILCLSFDVSDSCETTS